MGVKHLNNYLNKNCQNGITKHDLRNLTGKTIVVDAFIYLYKFMTNDNVYENMFNMCFKFRENNITPIFVFDGKTPNEKSDEVKKRSIRKNIAKDKYDALSEKLWALKMLPRQCYSDMQKIKGDMQKLKRQYVRVTDEIIEDVKLLISGCGYKYIQAPYEADIICAEMVKSSKAYAIMSEDMDYFIYGCPIVIRYFSIMNSNYIEYDYNKIMDDLDITPDIFKQICVYSGTDYKESDHTFIDNIEYYNINKELIKSLSEEEYIYFNMRESNKESIEQLIKTHDMFIINERNACYYEDINFNAEPYNKEIIGSVLKKENFVLV